MPRAHLIGLAALGLFAVPCLAGEEGETAETLIRMSVQPTPAPRPALRYRLLPELGEMNPGNPIYGYYKCCMEQQAFFFDKESFDRRETLLSMPIKELPARDEQEYGHSALSEMDRAARLLTPDWQILEKLRTDGFYLLLPDVQQLRAPARALAVRFRSEIALGRFDDAIRTAKTMLALARHLGEHPTLIGNLVGIAIANLALEPLGEMLERPGCPNLYWALTNLPDPLVSLCTGGDGERLMGVAEFRDLDDTVPMGADRIKKFLEHMEKLIGDQDVVKAAGGLRRWLDAQAKDGAKVAAARRRLVDGGMPEDRARRFPADQVILLDEKREYQVRFDDSFKLMHLPIWQVEAIAARLPAKQPPALLAENLLPSTTAVRRAEGRLQQRIALLRHVEALRLHAAEHDGKPPAKLAEVSVPLPDDPFTGKPFRYEVSGSTIHLRGSPPPGEEKTAIYNLHYELNFIK